MLPIVLQDDIGRIPVAYLGAVGLMTSKTYKTLRLPEPSTNLSEIARWVVVQDQDGNLDFRFHVVSQLLGYDVADPKPSFGVVGLSISKT